MKQPDKRFDTIKIDKSTCLQKEGMKIQAYIAGVNSGQYCLPFVIKVSTWAKKFGFKKFFYREMQLSIHEVKTLKEECEKVIEFYNKETLEQSDGD